MSPERFVKGESERTNGLTSTSCGSGCSIWLQLKLLRDSFNRNLTRIERGHLRRSVSHLLTCRRCVTLAGRARSYQEGFRISDSIMQSPRLYFADEFQGLVRCFSFPDICLRKRGLPRKY